MCGMIVFAPIEGHDVRAMVACLVSSHATVFRVSGRPRLGHATPQMTLRYASVASPTLRTAYDEAMGKMRRQFTLTPVGKPILPDKVGWLHSEMLKTRVVHATAPATQSPAPCPYANICETCDNYITAPEFRDALTDQLADIQALKTDAQTRGWTDEAARHTRVAHALTDHLQRLNR